MDWFVRAFMRASLVWLALGVTLGVAYYIIPRFFGQPLHDRRLAFGQLWLSNLGLGGMVAGFMMQAYGIPGWTAVLVTGGVLQAAGAYAFVYNIWRTIGAASVQILRSPSHR